MKPVPLSALASKDVRPDNQEQGAQDQGGTALPQEGV